MAAVTVLIPVHNEVETVGELFSTFDSLLKRDGFLPKFLVVNDASVDGTLNEIRRLRSEYGYQVKVINLKFNVGQHASLLVGTSYLSDTDFVCLTDADLQNPPEEIIPMLHKLKTEQSNIVYGRRKEGRLGNGFLSKVFWMIVWVFSLFRIPRDQTPLKVFDKEFIKNFSSLGSYSSVFFPLNLARVKARVSYYSMATVPRRSGTSKYNLAGKLRLFIKVWATIIFGYGFNQRVEVSGIDQG